MKKIKFKLSKIYTLNKKRMSKLKFNLTHYEKYNTKRVNILYGNLKLNDDCEVLDSSNTKYDYNKAVLKLSPEKADIIKEFEEDVNQYLEKHGMPKVTILYGNRIYPKMKKYHSIEKLKNIKLKGVYVNDENKSFPQLWVEY